MAKSRQAQALVPASEITYDPPVHLKSTPAKKGHITGTNVFEFVCAEDWHNAIRQHSFDYNSHRDSSKKDREALVQVGAMVSLIAGLTSWIHPGYVLIDLDYFRIERPIYVGDKVEVTFAPFAEEPEKRIEISVHINRDGKKWRVASTIVRLVRFIRPLAGRRLVAERGEK